MPAMNPALQYWTADEVAECLSISQELTRKMYRIYEAADDHTPAGGDGSNGTVETPDGRLVDHADQASHWWTELTEEEQQAINEAYEKDYTF